MRSQRWVKKSHLHEVVAVLGERSLGDALETLAHVHQRAGHQDLWLVVSDEGQGHAEQHFGTLVEKTVPYPQNGLGVIEKHTLP